MKARGAARAAVTAVQQVGPRWAAERARQVVRDEGVSGLGRRVRRTIGSKRAQLDRHTAAPPPSTGPERAFPASLLMVGNDDLAQCFHYRIEQKYEAARHLGTPFFFAHSRDHSDAMNKLALAAVLVLYRVAWSPQVARLVQEARRLRVPVVFETDDAVHRRDLAEANVNLATLPARLRRQVVAGSDLFLRTLQASDHAIASTEPLATDLARFVDGEVFVVENGIDSSMRAVARGIVAERSRGWLRPVAPDAVTLCYGSGSRAHDRDFGLAAPALARLMAARQDVHLRLLGPVRVPEVLAPFADRVSRVRDLMPYPVYLREMARCDIALAPLLPGEFNEAKSQVKYLEAGLVGLPLVASRTVYRRYLEDGETGCLATSSDEWYAALDRLVSDRAVRLAMGEAAASHVRRWDVERLAEGQYSAVLERLGGGC